MQKQTWLWVVLGVLAVITVGCLAVVGTGIYVVSRQVHVSEADTRGAQEAFEAVQARFQGAAPLLVEGPDGNTSAAALQRRIADYAGPSPSSLHVLAWHERERKLVRLAIPFWLLRFGSGGRHRVQFDDFDLERLDIKADDLERAGPALLLDRVGHDSRVMLWTE